MSETMNKLTRLQHLVDLGTRTKSELNALDTKIQEIVTIGGQPNVIEEIWLNGVKQTVEEKAVKLVVEQYDDSVLAGRVDAIEADYLVEADKTELQGNIDTVSGKVTTLIGNDANKSVRTIANEELAAQLIADGAKASLDTLGEIAAWIQSHPDDASAMNEAITALQKQVQGIGAGEGTVKKYVDDAIAALKIGDYAKAADLTALAGRVSTLEGKVSTWDAAEGNAKTYADGLNTAMDTRVKVVESKAHTHSFLESELNLIKSGDVAKWNVAEQNAKNYADGLAGNYDAKGSAAQALVDAKAYIDGMIATNAEVTAALDGIFGA